VGEDGNDDGTDEDAGFLFCSTFGIPNNNFPHTRAVKEKPTNIGHDIHNRARSSAPPALFGNEDDVAAKDVGRIQVRNGTAIPVFLDDSNNLMASLTSIEGKKETETDKKGW